MPEPGPYAGVLPAGEFRVKGGLPPDIAYCLDAEQEFGAIGADERAFVDLFDTDTVRWFDALSSEPSLRETAFAEVVRARHMRWRTTASPEHAAALDWAGLRGLRWLYADVLLAAPSEALRLEPSLLHSPDPGLISGIPARSGEFARFRRQLDRIAGLCAADIARHGPELFAAGRDLAEDLYRRRAEALRERDREIMRLHDGRKPAPFPLPARARKRRQSLARKAMAKSYRLLESVAGHTRARAWLNGDEVVVEGRKFDFRVRVADVRRSAHGALDVSVTDKDRVELASLCVYAPDTPALDQVASLVLHVVSGEEDRVLDAANLISTTSAAASNADFLSVRGTRPAPAFVLDPEGIVPADPDRAAKDALAPLLADAFAEAIRPAWEPLAHVLTFEGWLSPDGPEPVAIPAL